MIKSKLGLIGWFSLSFEVFFLLVITIFAADRTSGYFFSYNLIPESNRGKHNGFLLLFILIVFILFVLRILTILKLYRSVSIDTGKKTICIKRILTGKKTLHSFKDFDGYYDSERRSSYGSHKEILLIKKNKVINIISSEHNSNYNELLSSLSDLNYFGKMDYNLKNKIGMLFNKEIS